MTYLEKLSKLVYYACIAVIAYLVLRYFNSVVTYLVAAFVVSLICRPLMGGMRKIKIRGKHLPDWLLAIISILLLVAILSALISRLIPVIADVVTDVVNSSTRTGTASLGAFLDQINGTLKNTLGLKDNFKLEVYTMDQLKSMMDLNHFGNVVGSVAGTFANICIGLFSVVFISFFLIKDDKLTGKLLAALTPDKHSEKVVIAQKKVEHLLSRYFVGLIIEMTCVGLIDFIGLWAVAKVNFTYAIGIGFFAGVLNIIPYLGPVIGGVAGAIMCLILKYFSVGVVGMDATFWVFVIVLACIFVAAQLVDNFVLQPLIYSTSIQASALEIFIVLLIAGTVGGAVGMLVAIPFYTVVRVVAFTFFPDLKFVKFLSKQ